MLSKLMFMFRNFKLGRSAGRGPWKYVGRHPSLIVIKLILSMNSHKNQYILCNSEPCFAEIRSHENIQTCLTHTPHHTHSS